MKIAVAGLGLIGGSFYKASRKAGYETVGLHHADGSEALADADLVAVCLPPEAIVPWIKAHAAGFKPGAVVFDICGVKTGICAEMADFLAQSPAPAFTFVGGHPMAGREVAGYENALADLFVGASMIITPHPGTPDAVIERLKGYFAALGFAMTVVTTPVRHDEMIAFTSQLCHIISTAFARDARVAESIGFSAGSYADMTRIATQNADDWSALYQANQKALLTVLDGFLARMAEFRDALAAADIEGMKKFIRAGTEAKKAELARRKVPAPPRGDEPYRR
ncbi:MAG: prephenate dehydrogenase [Kiritimatiellia bacterium]